MSTKIVFRDIVSINTASAASPPMLHSLSIQWHDISMFFFLQLCGSLGDSSASGTQLRRQKRDWVVPAKSLKENYDYRKHGYIAKVRSSLYVANLFFSPS